MLFKGFEQADFDLFEIEGLDARMEVLKKQLRPKFVDLGEDLKAALGDIVGEEMFAHVAKHARRKTNPPNDSWVAFASNARGYKMSPHFQIAVWRTYVLIQWGIIYEATNKTIFSDNMRTHLEEIRKNIPGTYHWHKDHMKPEGVMQFRMSDNEFGEFTDRLKNNKNGEIMVGLKISSEKAIEMTPEDFRGAVVKTWGKLNYLHSLAR